MKNLTLLLICLSITKFCYAQNSEDLQKAIKQAETEKKKQQTKLDSLLEVEKKNRLQELMDLNKQKIELDKKIVKLGGEEEVKNNRISFVLGIGASYVANNIYQNPSVNLNNNNVIIEKAQRVKSNLTFGIVYTPLTSTFTNKDGETETVNHGISLSTFINPISLSKAAESQSFFNMTDFGVGLGYKFAGNVLVMATTEFFGVRQPKQWFIDMYKTNDQKYNVNGLTQLAFNPEDNDVFRTKMMSTFGFKVCYTFDIVKNFKSTSSNK